MEEKINLEFIPEESNLAIDLYVNREKNKNRYFIEGKNDENIFVKECSDYMNEMSYKKLPMCVSLYGGPLNKFIFYYYTRVYAVIPEGSKINAKKFMDDLEIFLSENKIKTHKSANSVTPFLRGLANFMITATSDALEEAYSDQLSKFEKNNNLNV